MPSDDDFQIQAAVAVGVFTLIDAHFSPARSSPLMSRTNQISELPTVDVRPTCCKFSSPMAICLVAVTILTTGIAAYLAGRQHTVSESGWQNVSSSLPLINASAAVASDKYAIATGDVADDAEGLFVLDHNSGLLQCSVIYPRRGQFMARFSVNVAEALGTGAKGGQYLMLTGRAQFPRASNRPAASTVVYVMDSTTGNYACYGIPFDHTAVARNQPQQGILVLIATGSANPLVDRDDLR